MAKINTVNYQTVSVWNGSTDLFVVEQADGTKVATPAQVKQYVEAGDFTATGEITDGYGNILKNMAKSADVKGIAEAGDFEATGEIIDGHGNVLANMAKPSDVEAVSDRLTIDVKSINLDRNQSATIESNSERDYWSMLCICFIPGTGSFILGFRYYNGTAEVKDLMTGNNFTSNYVDFTLNRDNLVVTSKNYTGYRFNFFRMPPYTI